MAYLYMLFNHTSVCSVGQLKNKQHAQTCDFCCKRCLQAEARLISCGTIYWIQQWQNYSNGWDICQMRYLPIRHVKYCSNVKHDPNSRDISLPCCYHVQHTKMHQSCPFHRPSIPAQKLLICACYLFFSWLILAAASFSCGISTHEKTSIGGKSTRKEILGFFYVVLHSEASDVRLLVPADRFLTSNASPSSTITACSKLGTNR